MSSPEARIHLEQPAPPCCSACYQPSDPEKRYVDFGASTDGPVTTIVPIEAVGVVGHVIDEIILCETCIAEAAKLVGLEAVGTLRQQLDDALDANDRLHDQITAQREGVASALETLKGHVTGSNPVPNPALPIAPLPPQKGRKRPARKAPARS